jgi:hypothetical protein
MPFDWNHFLTLARELQGVTSLPGVDREAVLRCAVSRAYYGAYGVALEYAEKWLGFRPRYLPEDHGALPNHFRGKRRANVADCLKNIREWRNQCDYHPSQGADFEAMLLDAIDEAQDLVKALPPPSSTAGS